MKCTYCDQPATDTNDLFFPACDAHKEASLKSFEYFQDKQGRNYLEWNKYVNNYLIKESAKKTIEK